jgi:zinc transport system permease protein
MRMTMIELFQYRFFINALLAAVLASISCGYIGTYIVSRRMVFISGGISHASFGGVGIAYFLGVNPILGAAVFSLFSALGIETLSKSMELRKDALVGMMWSFGMAVGVFFIFITPGYASNLMMYLFGNILTVSGLDLTMMLILTLVIIIAFTLLFKEIITLSFDEEYARTLDIPTTLINSIMISLVALTIVVNIRIVGIILVIALLTIPQATANIFSKKYKHIIFLAILFGLLASLSGLFLSYQLNIPSGATIIFLSIVIYLISKVLSAGLKKIRTQKT